MDWSNVFAEALPYDEFLDRHATPAHRARWEASHARFRLSDAQAALLGGFARRMPVLCLAGAWCGDCINQCPAFDHFARASTAIDLRFLDRDARPDVRDALAINGGHRVPVVVFLSEDGFEVARYGERHADDLPPPGRRTARPVLPDRDRPPRRRRPGPGHRRVGRRVRSAASSSSFAFRPRGSARSSEIDGKA